ncbi:MAG: YjjG family noncanonical pyrimidine nucleotidase [Clostridia bacterium]|nr:YjjG family noncanonical pyrimidine nucleotidase [Clostridia bacterium]
MKERIFELLIFDADHTLFDFDRAEREALYKSLGRFGLPVNDEILSEYKKINDLLWKKFEKNEIRQNLIKEERFRLLFKSVGINGDHRTAATEYISSLADGSYLLEGAGELIKDLSGGYRLAMLTNGLSEVQHPRFEKSGISKYFEAFIVSGDVGASKPNPMIFNKVLEKTGYVDKQKILMIGDSLTSDMLGGINFGVSTCWYNPASLPNKTKIRPDYQIEKLDDLRLVLEGEAKK